MSYQTHAYREIMTRAVCGTGGDKVRTTDYVMPLYSPTNILGCWIINHAYDARKTDVSSVEVFGSYDINIWYSYDDNTKTEVVKETIDYSDQISLSEQDRHSFNNDDVVIAKAIEKPHCMKCHIENGDQIAVDVEREFQVDVIGETKIRVKVEPEET